MPCLDRFVAAQRDVYDTALAELRAGRKQSHWMWFIFPQFVGLGHSAMAQLYGIRDAAEARDYLNHPSLGPRLNECTDAMLNWRLSRSVTQILGSVDALKFASSMTLFEAVGGGARFAEAIEGFFGGKRDQRSLALLASGD